MLCNIFYLTHKIRLYLPRIHVAGHFHARHLQKWIRHHSIIQLPWLKTILFIRNWCFVEAYLCFRLLFLLFKLLLLPLIKSEYSSTGANTSSELFLLFFLPCVLLSWPWSPSLLWRAEWISSSGLITHSPSELLWDSGLGKLRLSSSVGPSSLKGSISSLSSLPLISPPRMSSPLLSLSAYYVCKQVEETAITAPQVWKKESESVPGDEGL